MLAPSWHASLNRLYLSILLVGSLFISTVNGATCDQIITIQAPNTGDSGGTEYDQAAPAAALFKSFTIGLDNATGGFCAWRWTWIQPNGDETDFDTGDAKCTAGVTDQTHTFSSGERITELELHGNNPTTGNNFRHLRFTTNKSNNYVFGDADHIAEDPLTNQFTFWGPVTNLRVRCKKQSNFLEWTLDTCPCLTTQPSIYTLPDVSWVLGNPPSDFDIGYNYAVDPSFPLVDRSTNDCWGTFTIADTSTYTDILTITGPETLTGIASLVFDDATDDFTSTVADGLTATADGIMLEFTVTVTITTAADDATDLWYVDEATGSSALTIDETFTVYIMEPCTESAIVYDLYEFTVSMAIGDTANADSVATMTAHTYPTYCAVTQTYYDDGCSDCTHAVATASGSDD